MFINRIKKDQNNELLKI